MAPCYTKGGRAVNPFDELEQNAKEFNAAYKEALRGFAPGSVGAAKPQTRIGAAQRALREKRQLAKLVPNGEIPWGEDGAEFAKWFDNLTEAELSLVLKKYDLGGFIRNPGGKHEWLKVEYLQKFKEWKVPMSEIWRFRTNTTKLIGTIPGTNERFAHTILNPRTGRLQSGPGSGRFDRELAEITQDSTSLADFNSKLRALVKRWMIDPSLLTKPYPRAAGE